MNSKIITYIEGGILCVQLYDVRLMSESGMLMKVRMKIPSGI